MTTQPPPSQPSAEQPKRPYRLVAEAVCQHCTMRVVQDSDGFWRHEDGKAPCLPQPPLAAPMPRTIRTIEEAR